MTYLKATEDGYLAAEKIITAATKEALRAYADAYKEITEIVKAQYAKLAGVPAEEYYLEMLKYNRMVAMKDSIMKAYKAASLKAGKSIKTGLTGGMTENFYRTEYLSRWFADMAPVAIDPKLVEFAVTGNVKIWAEIQKKYKNPIMYSPQAGTLAELLKKNYTVNLDRILQTIENGLITGKSYTVQAKEIKKAIAASQYNAERIARTEGQRVLNVGALQVNMDLAERGYSMEKEWIASLDGETRASHRALDGRRVDTYSNFKSPITGATGPAPGQMSQAGDNINCRCTILNIIDGKGPETRVAINPVTGERDIISYQSYNEWQKNIK